MNIDLHEPGLEQYSKAGAVIANLVMVAWIALGTIACWFLSPVVAWIYLGAGVLMVWIVLRRLICVNCYYYGKWCAMGWGKLTAFLFKKGNIDRFGTSVGIKLAPVTYGLLSLIPMALLIVAMVSLFSAPRLIVFILLAGVSVYSATISRKKTCACCKMRLICPGCAAGRDGPR